MKISSTLRLFPLSLLLVQQADIFSQNISVNTTGAANSTSSMLEVLQPSTGNGISGVFSRRSGALAAASSTAYSFWSEVICTGATSTNVAGYFSASGATNNYAIIVPSTGGRVGIGTSGPEQNLSVGNGMNIDQSNVNAGNLTNGLTFGTLSGEGMASKRTATGNQYGLDFYTSSANRMLITSGGLVGINTTPSTNTQLHVLNTVDNNNAVGIYARITGATQSTTGVWGESTSPVGCGVYGLASGAPSGGTPAYGLLGRVASSTNLNSSGVKGEANATSGSTNGVWGTNASTTNGATAVYGSQIGTTGITYGVYGTNNSTTTDAAAIRGAQLAVTGLTYGTMGTNLSTTTDAAGVYGTCLGATGATNGVWGNNNSSSNGATGAYGTLGGAWGALAYRKSGVLYGVYSSTNSGAAGYVDALTNGVVAGWNSCYKVKGGVEDAISMWNDGNSWSWGWGHGATAQNYFSGTVNATNFVATGDMCSATWCASDKRYKKDVCPLSSVEMLNKVLLIQGTSYYLKTSEEVAAEHIISREFIGRNDNRIQIGFIAQDLENIFPEIVRTNDEGYKSVDYSKLAPVLVEALKEQQSMILALQDANKQLLDRLQKVESTVNITGNK